MKRWRAAFLAVLLAALPILFAWNGSPTLLADSDTKGILSAIRDAHDPWKWFRGDWPIANGFYRPISALTFEMDNALWGTNAAGYGLTNALLGFACVLLLFWALREVTDRPLPSAAGAILFALWSAPGVGILPFLVVAGAWLTLLVGLVRHRRDWRAYLPAFLTLCALSDELVPIRSLEFRIVDWIPGRTASTMALFALAAIAAYARFERLRRPAAAPAAITPETPPATRNTVAEGQKGVAWPWAVVAFVATALSMGAYEQGVMVPALLVVTALAMRLGGARPAWAIHGAFWSLIAVYVILRWQLLPHVPSGYQRQQYSSLPTAFWNEMAYLFPPLGGLWSIPSLLSVGPLILLDTTAAGLWQILGRTITTGFGYLQSRREPSLALFGWLGSAVAFLPMSAFKLFEHYHYLPMALRSGFVVALGTVALRLAASAWCPRDRPAPPRSHPAPGSLPRP